MAKSHPIGLGTRTSSKRVKIENYPYFIQNLNVKQLGFWTPTNFKYLGLSSKLFSPHIIKQTKFLSFNKTSSEPIILCQTHFSKKNTLECSSNLALFYFSTRNRLGFVKDILYHNSFFDGVPKDYSANICCCIYTFHACKCHKNKKE